MDSILITAPLKPMEVKIGLDMYLNANRFFWFDEDPPRIPELPEAYQIKNVQSQVAYWRKANAIHQWFVENVQNGTDDCGDYYVSREQLTELVETCKRVLTDPTQLGPELLPTQSGFFFGNTDYGDDYIGDLNVTIEQITKALEVFGPLKEWDFEYHSSW